jgi:hypothetical protein
MRNHGVFTISSVGYRRMELSGEFEKMMKDKGYVSPFALQQRAANKLFSKTSLGDKFTTFTRNRVSVNETLMDGETAVNREEWIRLRDEYIVKKIFEEFGWDYIKKDLEEDHLKYLKEELKPCEGAGGQCVLFCHCFPCGYKEKGEE